jgi:hypothetical protein
MRYTHTSRLSTLSFACSHHFVGVEGFIASEAESYIVVPPAGYQHEGISLKHILATTARVISPCIKFFCHLLSPVLRYFRVPCLVVNHRRLLGARLVLLYLFCLNEANLCALVNVDKGLV